MLKLQTFNFVLYSFVLPLAPAVLWVRSVRKKDRQLVWLGFWIGYSSVATLASFLFFVEFTPSYTIPIAANAASLIAAIIIWWRNRRRKRRSPAALGAKGRLIIAGMLRRLREAAIPRAIPEGALIGRKSFSGSLRRVDSGGEERREDVEQATIGDIRRNSEKPICRRSVSYVLRYSAAGAISL